jgi:hypothetical protein
MTHDDERFGNRSRETDPFRGETYAADSRAFRSASARNLPTPADTTRALLRALEDREKGGILMRSIRGLRNRPRLATALATAGMAALLLFVPISYQHTTGHEVTLELAAPGLTDEALTRIGQDLEHALGSGPVTVQRAPAPDLPATLIARVDHRSRTGVRRQAAAFAAGLAGRGIETTASVSPLRETVRGNVYLAAASTIVNLRIETAGRSEAEVAEDVRAQLVEAGVPDPEVDVDLQGDCAKICIRAPRESCDELPDIECGTGDGSARAVKIKVHRTEGMTDADVIADVENQLAAQGLSGTVTLDADGLPRVEITGGCE